MNERWNKTEFNNAFLENHYISLKLKFDSQLAQHILSINTWPHEESLAQVYVPMNFQL